MWVVCDRSWFIPDIAYECLYSNRNTPPFVEKSDSWKRGGSVLTIPVRFNVYRITAENSSVRDDLFEPLYDLSALADRHRILDGERVTLRSFERDDNGFYGVMYRSQTQALQEFLSDWEGADRPVPLDEERKEGLTGKTHFLYVPDYDIIVLQRGRRVVPPGMLRRYLCRVAGIPLSSVEIRPTLNRHQYEQFESMQVVSSIRVAFERPDSVDRLANYEGPEVALIRDAAETGAYNAVLQLGRGPSKKRWLDTFRVRKKVDQLLQMSNDDALELTSILVNGAASEDDKIGEVDLITDRMDYERSVAYDDRGLSTADAWAACREAYEQNAEDIESMYERRH